MSGAPMAAFLGTDTLIQASYFVTAVLFIVGLKRMSSPVTARSGILWAGAGMLVATLVTFAYPGMTNFPLHRRRHRRRRGPRLVERQARRHDRHAADDRALQRHGRRCRGGHRRRGALPWRGGRLRERRLLPSSAA